MPWYNKGLFSSLNLRQKTLLTIGLTGLILLVIFICGWMTNANLPTDFSIKMQAPSLLHPFGTDWMGRDMFTRTIKGLSLSIVIGIGASVISSIIATILAFLASANKWLDEAVSWAIDLFASIPHILLLMMISIALGKGAFGVIMAVAFSHWVNLTRVLRAEVLQINTSEYVALSNRLGRSKLWIAKEHILPLVISQIFVGTLLVFPHAIMHEASITFLGFGLSPHEPAIGIILSESMSYLAMGAWWLAFFPGLALLIVVLLFDIIGDNLKRLLDPGEANN
ncbi:MAG: ABC transporter permease [Methanobrevibacter sp.]|nr:ABC transporter permease [Methanobrevibacter sp.]MBO7159594.1 ABC transporter permease [Methanobrevibacter sp.]MBO7241999.1 ABC transporter permease [Methanobrevibacter sp.]MBO7443282.1 ABC transporter permease [Methanobrevibacter sp.]MBO7517788.1 ABC transporter permease [Methanobrevibacter sp.]